MAFRFNSYYFIWAILLFTVETGIALYVHDDFIRPYFGDFLVIILMYAAIRTVLPYNILSASLIALLTCYAIEIVQYLNSMAILNLQKSQPLAIILGNSFSWLDILAYTSGFIVTVGTEHTIAKRR